MTTISEEYRKLNAQLHETNAAYGTSSARWGETIKSLCDQAKTADVLDYGCGKGLLKGSLANLAPHVSVREYDPAIEGKSATPDPADIVVCTDVMEHIEPEHLDAVLDDLRRVTRKLAFITVATRPAVKFLADGRNAHLIVEPVSWWMPKFLERFDMVQYKDLGGEFIILLRAKSA